MGPIYAISNNPLPVPANGCQFGVGVGATVDAFEGKAKTNANHVVPVYITNNPQGTIFYNPLFQPRVGIARLEGAAANQVHQIDYRYFCHGHSLGTFAQFGYSVPSGGPLATVLADEYAPVNNPVVGGLAVWYQAGNFQVPHHSAIVRTVNQNAVTVSSKNGFWEPPLEQDIASVSALYGNHVRYFQ